MRSYEIGLSAIRTHQTTLQVIGNNIANVRTPGFHRQRVDLVTRRPEHVGPHLLGTGVEIGGIRRVINSATEDAILRNDAMLGLVNEELSIATDIESLFATGDSSIHEYFSEFFNNLESVANSPEIDSIRHELLTSGQNLLFQFANTRSALLQHSQSRVAEAEAAVEDINTSIARIAELNRDIRLERVQGREPLDLLDRRDTIASQLSEWTDVSTHRDASGREVVTVGGGIVSIGEVATGLTLRSENGQWGLYADGSSQPFQLSSGRVHGLLNAVNETIPDTLERLEEFAQTIVHAVDRQHAKGLRESGAFDVLRAVRDLEDPDTPLIESSPAFPISRGELTLTVTDPSTGIRTSHRVAVDPFSDSLTDVVSRFDAIPGVSAFLNAASGRLTLSGDGLRQIDFAGRVDNVPDLSSFAGSGTPSFSGQYQGEENDELSISFSGPGTIGLTDGLTATVVNSAGQTVATLDVGSGYEAGTDIPVGDGVSVRFASGTVNGTDTASVYVTADADPTGLLAALGINSLFEGQSLADFAVRRDITESPDLLAISATGFPGESSNIASIANLRDLRFESLEDRTFIEELADFTAHTGLEAQHSKNQKEQLDAQARRLDEQQAASSGVNTDEEFLEMLEVERAYQAAARFLSSVDETLDEIFRIIN